VLGFFARRRETVVEPEDRDEPGVGFEKRLLPSRVEGGDRCEPFFGKAMPVVLLLIGLGRDGADALCGRVQTAEVALLGPDHGRSRVIWRLPTKLS
jgi:hypothetical protein